MDPLVGYLREAIEAGRMPGAVWAVDGPSGLLSAGSLGLAALEPETLSLEPDTPYDLASLTKPLCTALALVLLEQEGRMSLTAPVEEWLPELAGSPYAGVTSMQLATHRSGLPAWHPLYLSGTDASSYLTAIAAQPRGAEATLYSDLGYLCLGFVVERVTGQRLDEWFERTIALPLGRQGFGFATRVPTSGAAPTERGNAFERELAGPAGQDHAWRETVIQGQPHDGNTHRLGGVAGHAGLFGGLADVLALAREILRPQRIPLGKVARDRLLNEAVTGSGRTVGFVLASASSAARGVLDADAPGHVGFTGTSMWLEPGSGRAYVLLTNRVHPVVQDNEFQRVRLEFHRVARSLG